MLVVRSFLVVFRSLVVHKFFNDVTVVESMPSFIKSVLLSLSLNRSEVAVSKGRLRSC